MSDEEITPVRAGALLAAAVQGVAWALIDGETDTADRGVSEEHYRDAVQRAQNILPTLLRGVVAEEPEWGVRHVDVDGWPTVVVHVSKRGAEEDFETCGMNCCIVERKVTGWVPVKQEGAKE